MDLLADRDDWEATCGPRASARVAAQQSTKHGAIASIFARKLLAIRSTAWADARAHLALTTRTSSEPSGSADGQIDQETSPKNDARKATAQGADHPKSRRPFVHIGDKVGSMIVMLCRLKGASIGYLCEATGWQASSVRSAIANPIKKKLRLTVTSEKVDGVRVYRMIV